MKQDNKKFIYRKVVSTTIKGIEIVEKDGKRLIEEIKPFTVTGKFNRENAQKFLDDKYPKKRVMVEEVTHDDKSYRISSDDFIKYGEEVIVDEKEEKAEVTED